MPVTPINSYDEFQSIINSGRVVIIDFWAAWCGPCRFISPIFEKLSNLEEYGGVGFYKVDVDEQEQISQDVGIRAMPTFLVYQGGQKVNEVVGANQEGLHALISNAAALA